MGLFSLFKRNKPDQTGLEPTIDAARLPHDLGEPRLNASSETQRQSAQTLQRDISRATTMKIDAIESAMAFDIFNKPEPAWGSGPRRVARPPAPASRSQIGSVLPLLEQDITELLSDGELPDVAVAAQTAPVVEEIAILFANNQVAVAQQMLIANLVEAGQNDRTLWWMLFDLYQVTGQQEQFDDLSIDYASKFETSPPAWAPNAPLASTEVAYSGVAPTQPFAGILDERITPQLERLQQLALANPVLRLEFNRVTGVEPAGCALLLQGLKALQAQKRELIVVAAAELANHIRAIVHVGRRDETQAPWLLLLELLQLLDREKEFEETSMDYCITFEVSPPSFMPSTKVATSAKQSVSASPDRFMLPAVIEGNTTDLIKAIDAYAQQYELIVFDCSRLARIDFVAAGQLLSRLQTLSQENKKIEFRDLNHLVVALLRLLSFSDIAKIFPHKY